MNNSDVYGGSVGGFDSTGSANSNIVTIRDNAVISKDVYGGSAIGGTANSNTITIAGSAKIIGDICGGYSENNNAVNNIITISDTPDFGGLSSQTVIYGGFSYASNKDAFSGNTLNLHSKGLVAANVANFAVYNFYLPEDIAPNESILTLTGGAANQQTDLSNSRINVGIEGTTSILKAGDSVKLLNNQNGIIATGITNGKIQQGVSLEYEFDTLLDSDGKTILATVKGHGAVTEQTKSPVETQVAAAAFVNSGADMVVSSGISSAVKAGESGRGEMFGAMGGGNMRYNSGSHADMRGYNLALGIAKTVSTKTGKLTYGPFVEAGWGNYTSHLDNGIRADGNTNYYGIGALIRQQNTSGMYYEGSLRYGRLAADYNSSDLLDAGDNRVKSSYDSSSSYYGLHIGIGKINTLSKDTSLDLYAKLLYTHQSGDSVTLNGAGNGEVYDFSSINSTRTRLGARFNKDYSKRGTGYIGLAYEYEFDGEANAVIKGFNTASPSIKGSSGMLELGYILQSAGNVPVIDMGIQGWTGKKQGLTANVNIKWQF